LVKKKKWKKEERRNGLMQKGKGGKEMKGKVVESSNHRCLK